MTETVDLTVIGRDNHRLFQPRLYRGRDGGVVGCRHRDADRSLLHRPKRARLKVLLDRAAGVEAEERFVRTTRSGRVGYDWLNLATGSTYSCFGHAEGARAEDHRGRAAHPQSAALHLRVGRNGWSARVRDRLLTFVKIGGGPTGVEMAGALAELAKAS